MMASNKICTKCKAVKGVEFFHVHKAGRWGLHSWCKECVNLSQRKTRKRKDTPDSRRKHNLATKYGITVARFYEMMASQHGKCGICGNLMVRPNVDHCHKTGVVRGLLCHGCNIKLPAVEDKTYRDRALKYLGDPLVQDSRQLAEEQSSA